MKRLFGTVGLAGLSLIASLVAAPLREANAQRVVVVRPAPRVVVVRPAPRVVVVRP